MHESIDTRVDTLDALIQRHAAFLANGIYVKMDTHGSDLEVFKGLRMQAGFVFALQSEASVRAIYEDMPDYVETIKTIEGLGFTLGQIFLRIPVKAATCSDSIRPSILVQFGQRFRTNSAIGSGGVDVGVMGSAGSVISSRELVPDRRCSRRVFSRILRSA